MVTTAELKSRINKLDYDLKEIFENVYIHEKSIGNQFFFDILCNGEFWNLNESQAYQRVEVKLVIHKSDLLQETVAWMYSSDPSNENAHYVQRESSLNKLAKDIEDVVLNLRMDESYFSNLPYVIENLNSFSPVEILDSDAKVLKEKIESFGIPVDEIDQDDTVVLESNEFMTKKPDRKYSFYHHADLKMSDKFLLEGHLNSMEGVNYTIFKEGVIEINFTPIQ
jgi:hypothetical protein